MIDFITNTVSWVILIGGVAILVSALIASFKDW